MTGAKLKPKEQWIVQVTGCGIDLVALEKTIGAIQADTLRYAAALIKEWHMDNTPSVIRSLEEQAAVLAPESIETHGLTEVGTFNHPPPPECKPCPFCGASIPTVGPGEAWYSLNHGPDCFFSHVQISGSLSVMPFSPEWLRRWNTRFP